MMENRKEESSEKSQTKAEGKKPYATPKLERHGSLAQLTERGSGSGDATGGRRVG